MWQHFDRRRLQREGVELVWRQGGAGSPLLLMHGHPQTMAMWHRVAPRLALQHRVILLDLRGYGDSGRPEPGDDSSAYSKREMGRDALHLMHSLGHERFAVLAHDRGARVAHRLMLDIAPTLAMYEATSEAFARAYWHWFFLIQPAPLPERLIEADPVAYLRESMGRRLAGAEAFTPEAWAEYERCIARPLSARAICSDYRASAGIDLVHDRADRDAGRRVQQPLRVLWGARGVVARCFDPLALWRQVAADVDGVALDCGHYIAEEAPEALLAEALPFFAQEPA